MDGFMERITRFSVDASTATGLAVLGGLIAAYSGVRALQFTWLHLLRQSSLQRYKHDRAPSSPPYALITGASDGIGKGFAEELCQRGFNVILHGRNASKLARVRAELRRQWPRVDVQIAVQDAWPCTEAELDALLQPLWPLHITVLVNNVGGGPKGAVFTPHEEIGADAIDAWIAINARFPTQLTAKLLPHLKQSAPALILNVSSFSALAGLPYLVPYSAAKAWNAVFSSALKAEMQAERAEVEVLGLWVGEVRTGHFDISPGFTRPDARQFARSALHKVGCGYAMVTPHLGHALQVAVVRSLPESVARKFMIDSILNLRKAVAADGGSAKKEN